MFPLLLAKPEEATEHGNLNASSGLTKWTYSNPFISLQNKQM